MKGRKPEAGSLRMRDYKSAVPAAAARLTPPDWLNEAARTIWRRTVPLLRDMGILHEADRLPLARYVTLAALWERLAEASEGRPDDLPLLRLVCNLSELLARFEDNYGMTPVGRMRLRIPHRPAPADTRADRFFPARPVNEGAR